MQLLAALMALFLGAAGLIHLGAPAQANGPADNPNMSVAEEIEHERLADIAAAELGNVWLEPARADSATF